MYPETRKSPDDSIIKIAYLIYFLHLFSALSGLLSPAFVVTAFLTGWPSLIGLVMSYIWRSDASETFLADHFSWLIGTFWWALLWLVIAWLLIYTLIGMVIGIPMLLIVGLWVLYRLGKGLVALSGGRVVR